MLRTDKPIYKAILVFNLLLIAAAVVLSVIGLNGDGTTITRIISVILRLLTLIFAGYYILSGYIKDAAKYLKLFGILYMSSMAVQMISCLTNTAFTMDIIINVLIILCIFALAFAKDLGKTKSFAICAILVILHIVWTVVVYSEGDPTIVKINMFMGIDLACLYGIMTYAKYLDKAERGTN